jgi:hypothetical protein
LGIVEHKPEEGVRVEQQPHGMYSLEVCKGFVILGEAH